MTIRILDDAVYEENLRIDRPDQHRGVILEATGPRPATIRLAQRSHTVWINGVPRFTLRGLHFESVPGGRAQVRISGSCPGVVLDRLVMTGIGSDCIYLYDVPLSGKNDPVVIQNCALRAGPHALRAGAHGVYIEGRVHENFDRPQPCGGVVVRNNTLVGCGQSVLLAGAVNSAHVVGNRILDSNFTAIDLVDLLPGTAGILVANNTLLRNQSALRVWDDSTKKDFRELKDIRVQNNLVLEPLLEGDFFFKDHPRGDLNQSRVPDLPSLLNSPGWRFSHNWREIARLRPGSRYWGSWIPGGHKDRLQVPIAVLPRRPSDPDFLRPPKDSPLAGGGAGVEDAALPASVGAVPPEGVEPWDWDKTWKALAR
jgi:hypothetical protein